MMWPYYYGGGGWSWLLGMGMMLLFWGAVFVMVIWTVRSLTGPKSHSDPAMDTLRKRLAAGEISQEDFEQTKKALT